MMTAVASSRNTWWWLVALAVLATLVFAAQSFAELHAHWLSLPVAGGYALVAMAVVLLYGAVQTIDPPTRPAPGPLVILWLTGCMAVILVSRAADVSILAQIAAPAVVFGLAWLAFGFRASARLIPGLLFLYLAIPFWQILDFSAAGAPSLHQVLLPLTILVSTSALRLTGIVAFYQDNLVHLASGSFQIAEACSGRGFFLAGFEISLFYGLMFLRSWSRTAVLVVIAVALSLIANWIRVYTIILIGYLTEMQSGIVGEHGTYGWLLFLGLVIVPVMLIGQRLQTQDEAPLADLAAEQSGSWLVNQRLIWRRRWQQASAMTGAAPARYYVPITIAIIALACLGLNWRLVAARNIVADGVPIDLPEFAGWEITADWSGTSRPAYQNPTIEAATVYSRADGAVYVYVAAYAAQTQGSEVVYFANSPVGLEDDLTVEPGGLISVTAGGRQEELAEWTVRAPNGRSRIVWRGLSVAGRTGGDEFQAKLHQLAGLFSGRADAAAVVLSTECVNDCGTARQRLSEFAGSVLPGLYGSAAASVR